MAGRRRTLYKARVHEAALQELLEKLRAGELTTAEVTSRLRAASLERVADLARIDLHRELRVGAPEIVYGESKSSEQIASIMLALDVDGCGALATRVDADKARASIAAMGRGEYDALSRTLVIPAKQARPSGPCSIGVVCAGTSDLPVAEEAAVSLEFLGQTVCRVQDVGVAGLHRIFEALPELLACDLLIVVAGMEGALPTVLAGLVEMPIIAVPTSVGYGVSLGGLAALASMLSSCAPGITVVNIDNGLGAALAALRIARGMHVRA